MRPAVIIALLLVLAVSAQAHPQGGSYLGTLLAQRGGGGEGGDGGYQSTGSRPHVAGALCGHNSNYRGCGIGHTSVVNLIFQ